jgi:hypothetical protein
MSTPEPLPRAHSRTDSEQGRDLTTKLQRMINLQYEEQHLSEREVGLEESKEVDPPPGTIGLPRRTATELMDLNAMVDEDEDNLLANKAANHWPSEAQGLPAPSPQPGVGRGTLYFPSTYQSSNNRQPSPSDAPPQQIYTGYGAVPEQHHEFHYGNPDYHDPYSDELRDDMNKPRPVHNFCVKICCLYTPIVNYIRQKNVHRSFCYGAIDGILTGSGIISAFCALHVLTPHTIWEVRLAVVAFTAAACVADAVCMAIGHVWTSYVVSSGHAHERARERKLLDQNKGDAKAKLVDMLLARGMLKIDAMSLADTLEGYPDLFVSALVGDSLLAGSEGAEDETDDGMAHPPAGGGSFGGFSWKFPSYGQFNEMDHEPEAGNVSMVVKESQMEGFFMMAGFATFAVIPSLLWLYLGESAESRTPVKGAPAQTISLASLIVSISAIIIWFLGVWKSRFLDSNWVICGIENVIVLLACVISAYGVGLALSYALGGLDGVTLTNVS